MKIEIEKSELRQLIFWALAGYTDSNGGTYDRFLPKTIAKYIKQAGMSYPQLPPMGVLSTAQLTGETYERVKKELSKVLPNL